MWKRGNTRRDTVPKKTFLLKRSSGGTALTKPRSWRIEFTAKAAKQFAKLDRETQRAINRYLDRVLESGDPTYFGKRLVGDLSGFWRYRVGKYRLICELQHRVMLIEIISIGKRDSVYG